MPIFHISMPTKQQFVHGLERVALVFTLATATYLKLSTDPFSKAALSAAGWAGVAAAYQAVISSVSTL